MSRVPIPLPIVVLVLMSFVMGTSEFMVMGILPDMAEGLGVEYTMIGGLVSVFAISYGVFTPMISGAVGRYDRFRIFMACSVLFLISNMWTMLAWDYWAVAASRVMTAAVSGVLFSISLTFVVDVADTHSRARSVALVYAGFNVSSILGVPMGTMISGISGWHSVFLFIAVMGVAGLVLSAITLPRKNPNTARMESSNTAGLVRDPRIIGGFTVTTLAVSGMYAIFTYINPFLEEGAGFTDSTIGVGIMLYGLMSLASNLISGWLAEHGGLRTIRYLMLVHAVVLASLPLLVGTPLWLPDLMLAGLMMYFMNSSVQLLMMEVASKNYPGSITLASSLNPTAFSLGVAIGSFSAGVVYDGVGLFEIGYVASAFMIASAIISTILCRYCNGISERSTSVT